MKKISAFFLCFILIVTASFTCCADNWYLLDDIGLGITVPDDYYVFTRDTAYDDENYTSLGISPDGLMSVFAAEDIYLEAMDVENFNNFVVVCRDTDEKNYFDLGVDGLYNAVMNEEKRLEDAGREIVDADIFESHDVDYVKIFSKADDFCVQYITVYNGKKYEFKYVDFDAEAIGANDEISDDLIEEVIFKDEPVKADKPTKPDVSQNETAPQVPVAPQSDDTYRETDNGLSDKLVDILIFVVLAILICTIPVLIFRFVFLRSGLRKRTARFFAFVYGIGMSVAFYYFILHLNVDAVGTYLCVLPLLWSFVVYKIVKYR